MISPCQAGSDVSTEMSGVCQELAPIPSPLHAGMGLNPLVARDNAYFKMNCRYVNHILLSQIVPNS